MSEISDFSITEEDAKKINNKLLESLRNYKNVLNYMSADLPIEVLCLNKKTEKILFKNGFLRVFELLDLDFTKIEGLNDLGCRYLTSRLNQFISMNM